MQEESAAATVIRYVSQLPRDDLLNVGLKEDRNSLRAPVVEGLYDCHEFQHLLVKRFGGSVLNAASADDRADLGSLGAINLDVVALEKHSGLTFVPRSTPFVLASVFALPFASGTFNVVVLGEFLEHCTSASARRAVVECSRVLRPGGHLVLTYPLDGRPIEDQRGHYRHTSSGAVSLMEYIDGVTCHHQTWWTEPMLDDLADACGFSEVLRAALLYGVTTLLCGWGLVWQKDCRPSEATRHQH